MCQRRGPNSKVTPQITPLGITHSNIIPCYWQIRARMQARCRATFVPHRDSCHCERPLSNVYIERRDVRRRESPRHLSERCTNARLILVSLLSTSCQRGGVHCSFKLCSVCEIERLKRVGGSLLLVKQMEPRAHSRCPRAPPLVSTVRLPDWFHPRGHGGRLPRGERPPPALPPAPAS